MKIELHRIPVREVVAGYKDSADRGEFVVIVEMNV